MTTSLLQVFLAGPPGCSIPVRSAAELDAAVTIGGPSPRDHRGQALAEYGLIILLVALLVFAAVAAFGGHLQGMYSMIASSLQR